MHYFDHYTIVVNGDVSPSDRARFASELQSRYRDRHMNGVDKSKFDEVATEILTSMGYDVIKPCLIEDIDYTGFDLSP